MKSGKVSCSMRLWSCIFVCKYWRDSSVNVGESTISTTSFKSISTVHATSPSGTILPIIKGKSLIKVAFSWPLPPIVLFTLKVFGIGWGLSTLSVRCYGNDAIFLCKYSRVKYLQRIISPIHKANSTGTMPSKRSWRTSGGKPVTVWKYSSWLKVQSPCTPN